MTKVTLKDIGQWPLTEMDEDQYNVSLEIGETPGEGKRDKLVYYLDVQPRHP
jgi:hypothetical protein